ncbi:LacI family DNA-binding transcriptional regulator [Marinovum sp. 2_MG-2023]|uniref:LacI family DNA-binding transcriptional regulator n=1 Tax=Roseobacteraceae TaxID=2854170 RepID=UPI001FCFBB15|nr:MULTISPECIES: LacI family DNA-binding transcriptional regulator [Roseobacteraceae]MCJ7873205.1 LacI family DNA-binding transcriptional regulator [Phaeobacter sp. J2-8]MDO6729122.1 LacI family DNA-binding transcriptional regulator [Marinovum sp. 2_MG-2023]MDO6779251.1 LacI family DNA-binding transcriptional regulator [Marinovum sp. 1_MG-2023]
MKKITAKDVADLAGVSTSAVSRAYRSDAPIAEDKRKAIFAAAARLGYVSNVDKTLSKQATNTIAMVVSELHNPFYPNAVDELVRQLPERGLKAIVHVVPSAEEVDTIMRQVLDFRTEGVILASSTMTSDMARLCRENGLPAVLLNRVQTDNTMMAVCCDNYGGAQQIASRFLTAGRQRIAFVGGRRDTSTHLERMRGFRDHLEEAGTPIYRQLDGGFDYQQAFRAAQDLLGQRPLPDAVFCANDIMAIAFLDAARIAGVSVPQDIAVIGFDDIPMASWAAYRLTTVRQPLRRMLHQAVDIITSAEASFDSGDIRILQGEMQERESG